MLNIAHIGYGYWGANVVKNINASSMFNLYALCDIQKSRLAKAEGLKNSGVRLETDYKKLLHDDNVDAFSLAIQTEPSFMVAKEVLNAGKHLFIEKPLADTAEKALALHELALAKKLILHCDHIMLFHPIIRTIKALLDSGELGEIVYIDISRMNLGPIRRDVNAMLDLAVHDLTIIDYLSSGREPVSIDAKGEKRYGRQETLTYLTMEYDGFLAHIKSSWISPIKERRIMIGCTKKMIIFNDMEPSEKLKVYDHGFVSQNPEDGYGNYEFKARSGDVVSPNIPHEDALKNSLEHFADCVNCNKQSLADGNQAAKVLKILDTARRQLGHTF